MANGQGFRSYSETEIAGGLQWLTFLLSLILFVFYAYQFRRHTCGWEGESVYRRAPTTQTNLRPRARTLCNSPVRPP